LVKLRVKKNPPSINNSKIVDYLPKRFTTRQDLEDAIQLDVARVQQEEEERRQRTENEKYPFENLKKRVREVEDDEDKEGR